MKANPVSIEDAKRFVRSVSTSFEAVAEANQGKTYNMAFGIALSQPLINKTDSEIKSYIDKLSRMVAQLGADDVIAVDLQIVEHGSLENQIMRGTREAYDASKALEGESSNQVAGSQG